MTKIMECVPNISEGRNTKIIDAVSAEVRSTPGCTLLHVESDINHNRSVITFIGDPAAVVEAAVRLSRKAIELIDLTKHTGAHPRMGAVDVIPFIPIKGMEMAECALWAKQAGERIWNELGFPVFLYEKAATRAHCENLASVRKGQFEGMPSKLLEPEWAPDFGNRAIHPTAGVVAVGARMPLIAFNINLTTGDVRIAKAIAKIIRQSNGGLTNVKALGIMLESTGQAQVSINMTDYTRTPLYRVLELVRFEAARYGVSVAGCELIGLSPMDALIESAAYYLQLEDFCMQRQVLEKHLK